MEPQWEVVASDWVGTWLYLSMVDSNPDTKAMVLQTFKLSSLWKDNVAGRWQEDL